MHLHEVVSAFINDKFELSGRLSRIKSGGYIDRSGSKLRSYFLQGIYKDDNTLLKILNFAGHEITDQAWFGIDSSILETNRKYNPAGEYYDKMGNTLYYNNQDERFGKSLWRWTYDYKVIGDRDISDLDDKPFVRKRRIRNRTVTLMYCNFFTGFVISMFFVSTSDFYTLSWQLVHCIFLLYWNSPF